MNPLQVQLGVTDSTGELRLYHLQMISESEIILFYGGDYDSKKREYIRNEIYLADLATRTLSALRNDERTMLLEYKSNIKNYRYIPPTTGEVIADIIVSAFGTNMDSSEATYEICSFDRSVVVPFHTYEYSTTRNTSSAQRRTEYKSQLRYKMEGREMIIKYSTSMPTDNANLSPDGNYMTLGNEMLNLRQGTREPLIEPYLVYSIDPSWSKMAIRYADVDGTSNNKFAFIGICDITIE